MLRYLYQQRGRLSAYVVTSLASYGVLIGLLQIYTAVTQVSLDKDMAGGLRVVALCALLLLASAVFQCLAASVKRSILQRTMDLLRGDVFKGIISQNPGKFYEREPSHYISVMVNDLNMIEENYFTSVLMLINEVILLLTMMAALFSINPWYALLMAVLMIPVSVQPFVLKKGLSDAGKAVSKAQADYTSTSESYISAYDAIKSYGAEFRIIKQYKSTTLSLENIRYKSNIIKVLDAAMIVTIVYFIKYFSLMFYTYGAITGVIKTAAVSGLFMLSNYVANPVFGILNYIIAIDSTQDIRSKTSRFLSSPELGKRTEKLKEPIMEISCEELSFSYDCEKNIVDQLNFTFRQNGKYLILGRSGCGKSTLLRLLSGYYDNYEGRILYNETDSSDLMLNSIYDHISVIHGTPAMFVGTIADNITMFCDSYTDCQIDDAIVMAGLTNFADSLEAVKDTFIGEGGGRLSGGERQRIAIARAILRECEVILADEATSALDSITAVQVEKTLLNLSNKMVISISHQLNENTVKYDEILVLHNGGVKASGSYYYLKEGGYLNDFESRE